MDAGRTPHLDSICMVVTEHIVYLSGQSRKGSICPDVAGLTSFIRTWSYGGRAFKVQKLALWLSVGCSLLNQRTEFNVMNLPTLGMTTVAITLNCKVICKMLIFFETKL